MAISRAIELLKLALIELTNVDQPPQPPVGPDPTGENFIYGKNGATDGYDPRTGACRVHSYDNNGRATGVWCGVLVQPKTRYQCVLVDLLPEDQSCNVYVDVQAKNGSLASKNDTRMLTGWSESTQYSQLISAPNSPGSFFMGSDAKFFPPNLGPIGACVVNAKGEIDSDIAGSMGLPQGIHVSFRVVFRER